MSKIKNLRLDGSGSMISVAFETDDARYHVWLPPSGVLTDETLYKNEPIGAHSGRPTRHLDLNAKANAGFRAAIVAFLGDDPRAKIAERHAENAREEEGKRAAEQAAQAAKIRAAMMEFAEDLGRVGTPTGLGGQARMDLRDLAIILSDDQIVALRWRLSQ